jgi:Uri superfamily endonuclease
MTKKTVKKGTYCLIVHLNKNSNIEVGKLGLITFKQGYYVYVGSALNSLESRLKRHLSSNKKIFWHVDYLLDNINTGIDEIIYAVDDGKWECDLASEISIEGIEMKGFGCSDCKCNSHLFYFEGLEKTISVCNNSFNKLSLTPKKFKK